MKEQADQNMAQQGFSMQEFARLVSHDIRAPLRHIRQFSKMLIDSLDSPTGEQQQYIEFIESSAERCNQMMDALLQLSKIHTHPIDAVAIDFEELFKRTFSQIAEREHCQPALNIVNNADTAPFLDAWHARLLVEAVAQNVFKFRSQGEDLKIELMISNEGDKQLIRLADNGIGVPSHFIDYCTTIFKQYDKSTEGVGVGLALVVAIAALYQGSFAIQSGADSRLGGATVTIALPLKN